MYFVSIDAGAQVAIILLACGPYVVIVNYWDRFCTLGRAPCTKVTLLEFHEWCRVTRRPRIFCGLMGCQRTPGVLGGHIYHENIYYKLNFLNKMNLIICVIITTIIIFKFILKLSLFFENTPNMAHVGMT